MAVKSERAQPKTERLEARITAEQRELFQMAASIEGRTVSEFVTHTALEAARRLIREQNTVPLSPEETRRFVDNFLHPPRPNPKLRRAAERYGRIAPR